MNFAESYLGGLRALVGNRPLISVGVRVLVEDQAGHFLITRRVDSDMWCLPGGAMELGESLLDAVRRETFEETNLTLSSVEAFGISSDPVIEQHIYPNGHIIQNVSLLAHALCPGGDIRSNDGEANEFRFAPVDRIPEEQFVKTEYRTFELYSLFKATREFLVV